MSEPATQVTVEKINDGVWQAKCPDQSGQHVGMNPLIALYGNLFLMGDTKTIASWEEELYEHLSHQGVSEHFLRMRT